MLGQSALGRLSWGLAFATSLFVVGATHLFVPKGEQAAVLNWIEDWLTNLAVHLANVGKVLHPATGGFLDAGGV